MQNGLKSGDAIRDWNNGLVIEDSVGNQFVWVPSTTDGADGTVKFQRDLNWANYQVQPGGGLFSADDNLPSGVTTEIDQITRFGGFYLARFQSGIPSALNAALTTANSMYRNVAGTPAVKAGMVPWNYIDYTNAKNNAMNMGINLGYDANSVRTGLVTGTQWDVTMKWLQNAGINVTTDVTGWGNYFTAPVTEITQYSTDGGAYWNTVASTTKATNMGWLLRSGHTDFTRRNNIYDLAGNTWEWTSEKNTSGYYMQRGGAYASGQSYSAYARRGEAQLTTSTHMGFRIVLFVK